MLSPAHSQAVLDPDESTETDTEVAGSGEWNISGGWNSTGGEEDARYWRNRECNPVHLSRTLEVFIVHHTSTLSFYVCSKFQSAQKIKNEVEPTIAQTADLQWKYKSSTLEPSALLQLSRSQLSQREYYIFLEP